MQLISSFPPAELHSLRLIEAMHGQMRLKRTGNKDSKVVKETIIVSFMLQGRTLKRSDLGRVGPEIGSFPRTPLTVLKLSLLTYVKCNSTLYTKIEWKVELKSAPASSFPSHQHFDLKSYFHSLALFLYSTCVEGQGKKSGLSSVCYRYISNVWACLYPSVKNKR